MTKTPTNRSTTQHILSAGAISVIIIAMTGCASTGQEPRANEGMRKGAIAGAAVGLTMGALAGSPELAAKGAIAGGVTGGAAGMLGDYSNDRQDYRAETIAAGLGGSQTVTQTAAIDTSWQDIDNLVGTWRVDIWGYDTQGQRVTAQATANGKLDNTRSVTMSVQEFQSDRTTLDISGSTQLSFDSKKGYQMVNSYSSSDQQQHYVGEYLPEQRRYNYYYTGSDINTLSHHKRSDYRVDMRFVGQDVIIFETWVQVDGKDVQIQSYRFTRLA